MINTFPTVLLCSFFVSCTFTRVDSEANEKLYDEIQSLNGVLNVYSAHHSSDKWLREELDKCMRLIELGKYKASDNDGGSRKDTPLMLAAALGDLQTMEYLIKNGASVNKANRRVGPFGTYNETALHYAAHKGRLEAYVFLLKNGANPDIRDSNGETAGMILRETVDKIISGKENLNFDI